MLYWLYELPTWLLGVLIVSSFTVIPSAMLIPARHYIRRHFNLTEDTNNLAGMFFSVASVFYGLLMGLVVVSTLQNFTDASTIVAREAANVGTLYRDVGAYPEPSRSTLREGLRQYADFIIDVAMPGHHQGQTPSSENILQGFQHALMGFNPETKGQEALHAESLRAYDDLLKSRQMRIQSVNSGLPAIFWIVVLIGTLCTIAITYFFHFRDIKLHVLFTSVTGFLIGLLIFLTTAYDNPFRGEFSVDAEPYRVVRDAIMRQPPAAESPIPPIPVPAPPAAP